MTHRVAADGKHLSAEGLPWRVKGITYGSFAPRFDGEPFPEHSQIKKDLVAMEAAGINTIRTYAPPPSDMLDLAGEMGLRLLVGLHYRDWRYETKPGRAAQRGVLDEARRALDTALERCVGVPQVLAISVGNEVPSDVTRTHGIRAVEDGLSELVAIVHSADSELLATYCNFPTTEYLHIEGQDLFCFNVFLEDPGALRRYLRRLQVISGDHPLLITELGLASEVHGVETQAETLDWQLRIVDEEGVAGATVFSWTDEWGVAGESVEGWGFGITDAERTPKPALGVVAGWARRSLRDLREQWPRVSVVVCAYNAEGLIRKSLSSLAASDYPNIEVIVCDDGSTDGTLAIAGEFPFRILQLPHGGLSRARNAGIDAATGDIVAFLDADAFAHPEWPYHLVMSLEDPSVAATGGPNLPVAGVGLVERAVTESPGGPIHVLIHDDRAEHVPGCNMAFKKEPLQAVGGFDPVYTTAGDDVDVCWKILDSGHEIAFAPAAQVRHHRRDSVRGYLRQQLGYGKAERLVAARHRHRFNRLGQARWAGFIYGGPRPLLALLRPVIYHGYLGMAPYQNVVHRRSETARSWATALLPLAVPVGLAGLVSSAVNAWGLLVFGACVLLVAGYAGAVALGSRAERGEERPLSLRWLIAFLHVAQPLVRVWGRLRAPSVREGPATGAGWRGDRGHWLESIERDLIARRCRVQIGDPTASWDLDVSLGPLVACRLTTAVTWGWTPIFRRRFRLRPAAYVLAGFSSVVLAVGNLLGAAGLATALVVVIAEISLLGKAVKRSIQETTAGATL